MKHAHNLIIYFTADDFEMLRSLKSDEGFLVNPGVKLEDAWLEMTRDSARLHVSYRGMKPNGVPHQRRTNDVIVFAPGYAGVAWLRQMLPDEGEWLHVQRFWPGLGWPESASNEKKVQA